MSAYVKQADQVVLLYTQAEAKALLDLAVYGMAHMAASAAKKGVNSQTAAAADRAFRTLEVACLPGSRTGAAIS